METKLAVAENMTGNLLLATPDTTASQALNLMRTFHIRHLPVVEGAEVVGIVSQRDLYGAGEADSVGDLMAKDPYVVRAGTPLSEVTDQMASEKYGSTVVVNRAGEPLGIFTTTDALRLLTNYLSKAEKERDSSYERAIEDWLDWDSSMGE